MAFSTLWKISLIEAESGIGMECDAADPAIAFKGPSIALTPILHKLVRAIRLCGRDGDAEAAVIRSYAGHGCNEELILRVLLVTLSHKAVITSTKLFTSRIQGSLMKI